MDNAVPKHVAIIEELGRNPETNPKDSVHFRLDVYRQRKHQMVQSAIAEFETQGMWEDARWLTINDATALVLEDRDDEAREILEGLLESKPPLSLESLTWMAHSAKHLEDYGLLARIIMRTGITPKAVATLVHETYYPYDLARLAFLCQVKGELPMEHGNWAQIYQQVERPNRSVHLSKRQVTAEEISALDLPPDLEEFIADRLTE
jgi:hypothetical protein